MKDTKRLVALAALSALFLMMATPASALFGKKAEASVPAGAPITQNQDVETYQGIPYQGMLTAVDNEGDSYTFSIVEQPAKGTVELMEDGGTFLYTPEGKKSGKDSFAFTATDAEGNTSAPAVISITIRRQKTAVTYSDMQGNPAYAAAIRLAEEGIFVGTQMAGAWFFDPDAAVSRSEFLAMAMDAAGIAVDRQVGLTGFRDDSSIAVWAKGYASAAAREGIISGVTTEEGICFRGDDTITVCEAAAVMDRLLDVSDVALEEEPTASMVWAAQAVANMESVRVVPAGSFGSSSVPVTRADAAQILAAALNLIDRQAEGGGLFGWVS